MGLCHRPIDGGEVIVKTAEADVSLNCLCFCVPDSAIY